MSIFYMVSAALRLEEFERARELIREYLGEILKLGMRVYPFLTHTAETDWRLALLTENLTLARKSKDIYIIIYGMLMLIKIIWAMGQLEKAVRLYAATLAASAEILPTFLLLDRTDFNHTLTGTLVQLDETTFKKAWAEGSAMTMEQAVEYALDGSL
jgi:hypothetical protein